MIKAYYSFQADFLNFTHTHTHTTFIVFLLIVRKIYNKTQIHHWSDVVYSSQLLCWCWCDEEVINNDAQHMKFIGLEMNIIKFIAPKLLKNSSSIFGIIRNLTLSGFFFQFSFLFFEKKNIYKRKVLIIIVRSIDSFAFFTSFQVNWYFFLHHEISSFYPFFQSFFLLLCAMKKKSRFQFSHKSTSFNRRLNRELNLVVILSWLAI